MNHGEPITSYNNKLAGALVGLARASEQKTLADSSAEAMIEGLALAHSLGLFLSVLPGPEPEEEEIRQQIDACVDRIHGEKALMAPDCAACQYSCGRTFDYDMEEIYGASESLRTAKVTLFARLCAIAARLRERPDGSCNTASVLQFLSDSMFLISCTYHPDQLADPLKQAADHLRMLSKNESGSQSEPAV